jgi:hypothetical protein
MSERFARWAARKLLNEEVRGCPIRDRRGREVVVGYDYERVHFGQACGKPWVAFVVGGGEAIGATKVAALATLRADFPKLFS